MAESFIYKNQKKLRCGYTTGTCAAAAAKAATQILLGGIEVQNVMIQTPKGESLSLQVRNLPIEYDAWRENAAWMPALESGEKIITCGIQKDGGDDVDATNGMVIYATVYGRSEEGESLRSTNVSPKELSGQIYIEGGLGIGRVTQVGLDQPVGNAAINTIPRKMIEQAVQEEKERYGYEDSLQILIWAPEGVEIAKKTFNERLGIQGGISILGTSGIVEPMSEKALIDTIRTEMQQKVTQGYKDLLVVPGNYGETFLQDTLHIDVEKAIKCSNYIGEVIDMAYEYQVNSMLIVGHIGKLVKLGAGIMNTHSKVADGRMEVLASCGILADVNAATIKKILHCGTTDEAIGLLMQEQALENTMKILMEKIYFYLEHRAYDGMKIGAITFSKQYGLLGKTENAMALLEKHQE